MFVRRLLGTGRSFAARLPCRFGSTWPMAGRALLSGTFTSRLNPAWFSLCGQVPHFALGARYFSSEPVSQKSCDTFFRWMDSKCDGEDGWGVLFAANEWVPTFKRVYKTDEDLAGLLATVNDISFDTAKSQLKEKVGDGIGKVFDEVVNKLTQLFDEGGFREGPLQPKMEPTHSEFATQLNKKAACPLFCSKTAPTLLAATQPPCKLNAPSSFK